jgi:hypothetical protein
LLKRREITGPVVAADPHYGCYGELKWYFHSGNTPPPEPVGEDVPPSPSQRRLVVANGLLALSPNLAYIDGDDESLP